MIKDEENKMNRQDLRNRKRIVVKIGTTSLTYPNGNINFRCFDRLAAVLTDIRNSGREVILVSSGAIAVGAKRLGLAERPRDIIGKQASSAVGQAILMQYYEKSFNEFNQRVAQILLTKDIFNYDHKRANVKNTLSRLIEMGVIPIVNENDTVATEEFNEFSDNDTLASYVTELIGGDLLILLSDIDGMFTGGPNKDSSAKLISVIESIDENILRQAGGSASALGTGGMASKVQAAAKVNAAGCDMVIAKGDDPSVIYKITEGEDVGTLFLRRQP